MIKTLRNIARKQPQPLSLMQGPWAPRSRDEQKAVAFHKAETIPDNNGNEDDFFKASNVKMFDRLANRFGYNPDQDEKTDFKVSQEIDRPEQSQVTDLPKRLVAKESIENKKKLSEASKFKTATMAAALGAAAGFGAANYKPSPSVPPAVKKVEQPNKLEPGEYSRQKMDRWAGQIAKKYLQYKLNVESDEKEISEEELFQQDILELLKHKHLNFKCPKCESEEIPFMNWCRMHDVHNKATCPDCGYNESWGDFLKESEQIDEISKGKLNRYINKASDRLRYEPWGGPESVRQRVQRHGYIEKAENKIYPGMYGHLKTPKVPATEETQIDELFGVKKESKDWGIYGDSKKEQEQGKRYEKNLARRAKRAGLTPSEKVEKETNSKKTVKESGTQIDELFGIKNEADELNNVHNTLLNLGYHHSKNERGSVYKHKMGSIYSYSPHDKEAPWIFHLKNGDSYAFRNNKEAMRHLKDLHAAIDKMKKTNEDQINEKLHPSMGIGAYIDDFKKSTDSRFDDDSEEKRILRAKAAYFADLKRSKKKKNSLREIAILEHDVPQLNPVPQETANPNDDLYAADSHLHHHMDYDQKSKNYRHRAEKTKGKKMAELFLALADKHDAVADKHAEIALNHLHRYLKSKESIEEAIQEIENLEQLDEVSKDLLKKQIDEISKEKVNNYLDKAEKFTDDWAKQVGHEKLMGYRSVTPNKLKYQNRKKSMVLGVKKLTNWNTKVPATEETQIDEISKEKLTRYLRKSREELRDHGNPKRFSAERAQGERLAVSKIGNRDFMNKYGKRQKLKVPASEETTNEADSNMSGVTSTQAVSSGVRKKSLKGATNMTQGSSGIQKNKAGTANPSGQSSGIQKDKTPDTGMTPLKKKSGI